MSFYRTTRASKKEDKSKKTDRSGTGFSFIYRQPKFKEYQKEYEDRLGKYAYNHPRSYAAVNSGLAKMKQVLYIYYEKQYNTIADENEKQRQMYMDMFTYNNIFSAGQIGFSEKIIDVLEPTMPSKETSEQLADDMDLNEPGNLREKVTAFYNATLCNKIGNTFKNIIQDIAVKGNTDLINKLDLKYAKEDIIEEQNFMQNKIEHKKSKSNFLSRFFRKIGSYLGICSSEEEKLEEYKSNLDVYDVEKILEHASNPDEDYISRFYKTNPLLRNPNLYNRTHDYQDLMGLSRTRREKFYQSVGGLEHFNRYFNGYSSERLELLKKRSPIINGGAEYNANDLYNISDKQGFQLISGTSMTTTRMLDTYKWLGLKDNALDFRLALIGWMLPERDHSLWEILNGSHVVGIYGNEDLTDAETMDRTVYPLTEEELRQNVCEQIDGNKMFPLDRFYYESHKFEDTENLYMEGGYTQKYSLLSSPDIYSCMKHCINTRFEKSKILSIISYSSKSNCLAMMSKTSGTPEKVRIVSIKKTLGIMINNDILLSILGKFSLEPQITNQIKSYIVQINGMSTYVVPTFLLKYKDEMLPLIKDKINIDENSYIDEQLNEIMCKSTKLADDIVDKYLIPYLDKYNADIDVENNMLNIALRKSEKFDCNRDNSGNPLYSAQQFMKSASEISDIFSFDRFTSTTKCESVCEFFMRMDSVIYEIRAKGKSGVDISKFSLCAYEEEVLFLPEAKFVVTDIKTASDGRITKILCEEI